MDWPSRRRPRDSSWLLMYSEAVRRFSESIMLGCFPDFKSNLPPGDMRMLLFRFPSFWGFLLFYLAVR